LIYNACRPRRARVEEYIQDMLLNSKLIMKPRTGAERKQPQDIFLVEEGEKTRDRIDTRYILGVSRKPEIE